MSLKQLRQILTTNENPPYDEIVSSGIISKLISYLSDTSESELRVDSLLCLVNISSGSHEQTNSVLPASSYFIAYLLSDSIEIRHYSTWAIGNLAGDCQEYRDILFKQGVVYIKRYIHFIYIHFI